MTCDILLDGLQTIFSQAPTTHLKPLSANSPQILSPASYSERTIPNEYFVDIKISLLLFLFASFSFPLRSIDMKQKEKRKKESIIFFYGV